MGFRRVNLAAGILLVTGVTLIVGAEGPALIHFTNVAQAAGIHAIMRCGGPEKRWIPEANGSGAAWLDYDNDGLMDLLIVNGSTMERLRAIVAGDKPAPARDGVFLFHNLGGGRFEDVTERAGLANAYWGTGTNAADYNNDGYADILITTIGRDLLYRNNGNGTFTDVSVAAGLSRNVAWHTGSTFGDFDNDGFLDLYVAAYIDIHSLSLAEPAPVCPYSGLPAFCGPIGLKPDRGILYRNNGDGTFREVTTAAGLAAVKPAHSFTPVFSDFNGDGKPDLFIANDSDPNLLFLNQGNGTFKEAALDRGVAMNGNGNVQSNMGVAIADLEGNGRLSLVTTTFMNDYFPIFRQDKSGFFDEVSSSTGLNKLTHSWLGWACGFGDFANDGNRELWLANGHVYPSSPQYFQPVAVLRQEAGQFHVAYQFPAKPDTSYRGGATADFENTGKVGLLILPIAGEPLLLKNDAMNANSWIGFRLRGTRSNRDAIGTRVKIDFCGKSASETVRNGGSYLSENDPRLHFGLGTCGKIDKVTVQWPAGGQQELRDVPIGRYESVQETR